MDGSYGKRTVSGIAAPKKKSVTAVKDTAGSRDGTGQSCNKIGCCGRVYHNTRGTINKSLEKPKSLKPNIRSSSIKDVTASSYKKCSKSVESSGKRLSSKIESSTVSNGSGIQELNAPGTQTRRLKTKGAEIRKEDNSLRVQNIELNNVRKKRLTQGESSSSGKGKQIIGVPTIKGRVFDSKNPRNFISSRTNGVSSVRTRKTLNLEASKGSNSQQDSNVTTDIPQTQALSLNGDHSTTSDTSTDRSARHYNLDGIADVLLALDRFRQDDGLTYEQLLSLEANIFAGLNVFDQHRDMRLDIDNMSYEELLALEEKMGTVSTALSKDELAKCIKTSVYEHLQSEDGKMRCSSCPDDSKCSICQEEFVKGDEMGRLGCGHAYHNACINQWLGLKNWCPICKASPERLSSHA